MEQTALVSSQNRPGAQRLTADALMLAICRDALMLVICRVAGGSVWRLYKRLMLWACVGGAIYGYLISLDERRRRGGAGDPSTA